MPESLSLQQDRADRVSNAAPRVRQNRFKGYSTVLFKFCIRSNRFRDHHRSPFAGSQTANGPARETANENAQSDGVRGILF